MISTTVFFNKVLFYNAFQDLQATFDEALNENVIDELLHELGNIPENAMEQMFPNNGVEMPMLSVDICK